VAELEEAVYAILTEDAAVGALVGTRVYPQAIPQDVGLPATAYARISTKRVKRHGGSSGLKRARVQVNSTAREYDEAKAVAAAVCGALDGVQRTVAGIWVQGSWAEGEGDEYAEGDGLHGVRQDFMIWYVEATG